MHPATHHADSALVDGVDTLNRLSAELKPLRASLATLRLPNAAAADRLDNARDLLTSVSRQLGDACAIMAEDFEQILRADSARYDFANDNHADAA